jgi:hypothetical protein
MTAAADNTPPEWVSRSDRLHWIIWIAHRYSRLELDEAGAEDLIPYVVELLRHDPDNTLNERRPFARWTPDGLCDEIAFLVDYDVNWGTWELRRTKRLEEEPLNWIGRTFMLAVAWYKFRQDVLQALRQAGLPAASEAKTGGTKAQEPTPPLPQPKQARKTLLQVLSDAFVSLHQEKKVDINSHAVRVLKLGELADEKAGRKPGSTGKATVERALSAARVRVARGQ